MENKEDPWVYLDTRPTPSKEGHSGSNNTIKVVKIHQKHKSEVPQIQDRSPGGFSTRKSFQSQLTHFQLLGGKTKKIKLAKRSEFQTKKDFIPEKEYYFTCKCEKLQGIDYCCGSIYQLLQQIYNNNFDYEVQQKQYHDISRCGINCQELQNYDGDIEKDLLRTFPKIPQFAFYNPNNTSGVMATNQSLQISNENYYRLKRVLQAFAYYDHSVGYMQGMNFIMASIMYHCNEEVAFWVFVQLMQLNNEVRSIYQPPNMPGLALHVQEIERLIALKMPSLNEHLINDLNLVTHQIYLHDWIICLFSSIMPIDRNIEFLTGFFKLGWTYFYQMCLSILKELQPYIHKCKEIDQILSILKFREITKRQMRKSFITPTKPNIKTQNTVFDGRKTVKGPQFSEIKNMQKQNEISSVDIELGEFEQINHQDALPQGDASCSDLEIANDEPIPYSTMFSLQNRFKNFGFGQDAKNTPTIPYQKIISNAPETGVGGAYAILFAISQQTVEEEKVEVEEESSPPPKQNFFSTLVSKYKDLKEPKEKVEEFDDLSKINFEQVWDKIFENVHKIDI